MAQGRKVVTITGRLWVRAPLEEKKFLFKCIFPFLRSGVEAKSGVEFRRTNSGENGEQSVLTRFSLPICCVRNSCTAEAVLYN